MIFINLTLKLFYYTLCGCFPNIVLTVLDKLTLAQCQKVFINTMESLPIAKK